jgi:hypothetical protein
MAHDGARIETSVLVTLFLLSALAQVSGCSFARYPVGALSRDPEVARIELKTIEDYRKMFSDVEIADRASDDGVTLKMSGVRPPIIELGSDKTLSVKYHRSLICEAPQVHIILEFPNGRKYPAYLDTGAPGSMILTGDIVLDNKFVILPSGPSFQTSGVSGMSCPRIMYQVS